MKTTVAAEEDSFSTIPISDFGNVWIQRFFGLLLWGVPGAVHGQFDYTAAFGQITITGYTGPGGAVKIPSTLDGLPVTTIGTHAFYRNTDLTSITLPDRVTKIGLGAFAGCTGLTEICFCGNAPHSGSGSFTDSNQSTVYHVAGALGWGATFAGRPTALWIPPVPSRDPKVPGGATRFYDHGSQRAYCRGGSSDPAWPTPSGRP